MRDHTLKLNAKQRLVVWESEKDGKQKLLRHCTYFFKAPTVLRLGARPGLSGVGDQSRSLWSTYEKSPPNRLSANKQRHGFNKPGNLGKDDIPVSSECEHSVSSW